MSECFRIKNNDVFLWIEIVHPPEAIEMVEVEVYKRLKKEYNPRQDALMPCVDVETEYFIKLPFCKQCGMFVKGG